MALAAATVVTARTHGQDAVRPSLAGAQASIARMDRSLTQPTYNLKLGQFRFSLSAGLGTEFNDNINLAETGAASDVILTASLSVQGEWKATTLNDLRFGLNLGYSKYIDHPQYDTTSISIGPDSQLSYDFYVGGTVKVTLQDRFGITQDPTEQASLSNIVNFRQFQNTTSVNTLIDLNKIILTVGYDHYLAYSLSSAFNNTDRNADSLRFSGAYQLNKARTVGVDASTTYSYSQENFLNNGTSFSAGPFLEQTISRYLTLRASGGFQEMQFDHGGLNQDTSNLTGWYGGVELAHRVNRFWTQTFSIGHESSLALQSNYETANYVRYGSVVQLTSKISVNLNAFYEQVTESGGVAAQDLNRFGGGLGFGYQLNRHLSLTVGYQYINKTSNLMGADYTQNRVFLNAGYKF